MEVYFIRRGIGRDCSSLCYDNVKKDTGEAYNMVRTSSTIKLIVLVYQLLHNSGADLSWEGGLSWTGT